MFPACMIPRIPYSSPVTGPGAWQAYITSMSELIQASIASSLPPRLDGIVRLTSGSATSGLTSNISVPRAETLSFLAKQGRERVPS